MNLKLSRKFCKNLSKVLSVPDTDTVFYPTLDNLTVCPCGCGFGYWYYDNTWYTPEQIKLMTVAGPQPGLAPAGALRPRDATKEVRSTRHPGVVVVGVE